MGDVQSLLNKLTLENFDVIYNKVKARNPQSIKEYKDTISLIYDKAVMEQYFSTMYARLCILLNSAWVDVVNMMLATREEEGGFVCYDRTVSQNPIPISDVYPTEEEALEATKKKLTVRHIIAEKCQDVGVIDCNH